MCRCAFLLFFKKKHTNNKNNLRKSNNSDNHNKTEKNKKQIINIWQILKTQKKADQKSEKKLENKSDNIRTNHKKQHPKKSKGGLPPLLICRPLLAVERVGVIVDYVKIRKIMNNKSFFLSALQILTQTICFRSNWPGP